MVGQNQGSVSKDMLETHQEMLCSELISTFREAAGGGRGEGGWKEEAHQLVLRQSPDRRLCKYPNPATMHPLPSPSPRQLIMPATPHRVLTQITFSRSKFRVTVRRTHFNNLEML